MREIRIPLYGIIQLDDLEWEVVNSRPFQRLRRIKQLAFSDYVYPGAVHTRFEHSLGVMHLVTQAFERIKGKPEVQELFRRKHGYDDKTWEYVRRMLRLAGLTHDLGHMPYSHAGEAMLPLDPAGKPYKHEAYSVAIVRHYINEVIQSNERELLRFDAEDLALFLEGRFPNERVAILKPWRGLISGELDCDRMHYLHRDSHHLGVEYGSFDVERVLSTLTMTADTEDDETRLAVEAGGLLAVESLILARYYMFIQVYFHKVRRYLDLRYAEALAEIGKRLVLSPPVSTSGHPDVKSLESYLALDDWVIQNELLEDAHKGSEAARAITERSCWKVLREVTSASQRSILDQIETKLTDLSVPYLRDTHAETRVQKFQTSNILVVGDSEFEGVRPIVQVSQVATSIPELILLGRIYVPDESRKTLKSGTTWSELRGISVDLNQDGGKS